MAEMKGTITRRLDHTLNELFDDFKIPCTKDYIEQQMGNVENSWHSSERGMKLRRLFDLLDANGIPYEVDMELPYYQKLVRSLDDTVPKDIGEKMLLALFDQYQNYPDPNQYMKRLVDRFSGEDDPWRDDPLRLRILKRFIQYGNYLQAADYSGKAYIEKYVRERIGKKPTKDDVLETLDDGVFDVLETATRDQRKKTYSLLRLADDLGNGKFRVEGSTKKGLYMFAMAYDMTYSISTNPLEGYDPATDIDKNLFQDYYTNNLIRFLTETYRNESGKRGEKFEMDPSGQGINYKNFAEIIYIYFISRDDLTPVEKIEKSSEMIREVSSVAQSEGSEETDKQVPGRTQYFRDLFGKDGNAYSEDILGKSEPEFKQFILDHYDCRTQRGSGRVGVMQVESDQKTASLQYEDMVSSEPLSLCIYGLQFAKDEMEDFGQNFCSRHPDIDPERFREFCILLRQMDRFMMDRIKSIRKEDREASATGVDEPSEALLPADPSEISRTTLIIAFYYSFNNWHEAEDMDLCTFEEYFDIFKSEVDEILTASFYQPLSGKNFLDVLIVCSAYSSLFN